MRVLSFASVLLLAVTGFAAVAPTTDSSPIQDIVNAIAAAAPPSNQAAAATDPVQNMINIMSTATNNIKDPSISAALQGTNPGNLVDAITKIKNDVFQTVEQLKTARKDANLTPSDMTALVPAVFSFLTSLNSILVNLIPEVIRALTDPTSDILEVLNDLLSCVSELIDVLKSCIVDAHAHVLAPVFKLIVCIVQEVASFFGLDGV